MVTLKLKSDNFHLLSIDVNANKTVIVHTNYGDAEGYETELAQIFYDIPYAQPPVNTLRTYAEYVTSGVPVGEQLNYSYTDISCFRAASYQQIVAAQKVANTLLTSLKILLFLSIGYLSLTT
ncbi:unnamed protein product [Rotaria magnacalcarata]|uniref:Uncharacterized protein n=2 Tax=Rotaria magnacalcarata TaxID=392030 RepID=A0A8S2MIT4_9BILA|nr:unnamed protein product [Rotaria magnacalcarata]